MAYACPVCDSLAPDGEHLAHHLAIVAMSRGGEHEAWLDDHAEGWREASPEDLAALAVEHAETVDHELADATAGDRPDVGHHHGAGHAESGSAGSGGHAPGPQTGASDEETAEVLTAAREMTRTMLDGEDGTDEGAEGDREEGGGSDENSAETDSDE